MVVPAASVVVGMRSASGTRDRPLVVTTREHRYRGCTTLLLILLCIRMSCVIACHYTDFRSPMHRLQQMTMKSECARSALVESFRAEKSLEPINGNAIHKYIRVNNPTMIKYKIRVE